MAQGKKRQAEKKIRGKTTKARSEEETKNGTGKKSLFWRQGRDIYTVKIGVSF
ncbi:MAG: hypothetical protein GTN82_43060 [Candidatus Aminicenantes bacterium]|nr:hypothetical protein [Candidatus Aminicenantes bacterium]NIN23559.1 hypothetical protein [Candidatus Aminicenantes bacterium]NIR12230.1 hypothetical protein [Candidatus Aminicenantes bacterium]